MKIRPWIAGTLGLMLGTAMLPVAAQQSPGNQSSQIQAEAIANQRAQARTQASRERAELERPKPASTKTTAETSKATSEPVPLKKKSSDSLPGY